MKNQSERKIVIFDHSSTATSLRTAKPHPSNNISPDIIEGSNVTIIDLIKITRLSSSFSKLNEI